MTILTSYQISQLHSNGVYTIQPEQPLFSLATIVRSTQEIEWLDAIQTISKSPNPTVAASFFMRRYGMFTAMQLYQFIVYEDIWKGELDELQFGVVHEFGNRTISTFPVIEKWTEVSIEDASTIVRNLLLEIDAVSGALRATASISSNVLWENVFGFWLWHFHVLLNDPLCSEEARLVLNYLQEDATWIGISTESKFAKYLAGQAPSDLLNTTVRKTCCLSKDVPGLMQCGFCPLKKK